MKPEIKTMRDVMIELLCSRMEQNADIFFLSADFGSPKLDILRERFKDRFLNVGIAEQNLINVATGLALEGFAVYAYAIAPFLTMRAFEQIRINLALQSQLKDLNVNLIGVGAGLSYDVSGPTHHCLEDITILRALPNLMVFSPADWVTARQMADYSLKVKRPKYFRLDGKPLPNIYDSITDPDIEKGFMELRKGDRTCLVSTGYMTHKALRIADKLMEAGTKLGMIDVCSLKPLNEEALTDLIRGYDSVVTLEEAFIGKGGLDSMISSMVSELSQQKKRVRHVRMGFKDAYVFDIGGREYLHRINGLSEEEIIKVIKGLIKKRHA